MRKIFIIGRGLPNDKYPMNGIFEYDQAKALSTNGNEVTYIYVDNRSIRRKRKFGIHIAKNNGIKIYGMNYPLGKIPMPILMFFYAHGLKRILNFLKKNDIRPDIMHAHFPELEYATIKNRHIFNVPIILTEHFSGLLKKPIDPNLKKILSKTYRYADQVITVSEHLNKNVFASFNVDSKVVPNLIDIDKFKPSLIEPQDATIKFISVGGLTKLKRMDILINAFSNVFSHENASLKIIGDGPEREKLERIISNSKAQDKIELLGKKNREEIADYLNESNCFVLVSEMETFGLSFVEALASGLPVISTKSGGPEEFINDENGILIDVDNQNQLEEALKSMYINSNKFDREKISEKIRDIYSSKFVVSSLEGIYDNLIFKD